LLANHGRIFESNDSVSLSLGLAPAAMPPRSRTPRLLLLIVGLTFLGTLCAVALLLPPDGKERASTAQFFGRFHPVLLHAPIALLLTVPLLELARRFKSWAHVYPAAGVILGLATVGAFAATGVGWLLAWSGGYQGETVARHLWGGIALCAVCFALVWLRLAHTADGSGIAGRIYPVLLFASLGLVSWTSHQGSVITHGEDFLTKHVPGGLRRLLGVPPEPERNPPAATFYSQKVAPLMEKNCVSCHQASKHKAGLRLDTYTLTMTGGDGGPPVVAGSPEKSELYRRITLDPGHEEFMPTDGKPPLTPAEIKLVAEWISAGAAP
jgi:mono/diheme cytochrome c family protein